MLVEDGPVALARNLALLGFLLGDVASLGCDEHNVAVLIPDRAERGVNNDGLRATGASVDFRIPANEFALRGPQDRFSEDLIDFLRDLPPEGCPKRLSLYVGELKSSAVERDLIDFKYRAVCVEKSDELDHGIQRDSRKFLSILLTRIPGKKRGATNVDEPEGHGWAGPHLRPKESESERVTARQC